MCDLIKSFPFGGRRTSRRVISLVSAAKTIKHRDSQRDTVFAVLESKIYFYFCSYGFAFLGVVSYKRKVVKMNNCINIIKRDLFIFFFI